MSLLDGLLDNRGFDLYRRLLAWRLAMLERDALTAQADHRYCQGRCDGMRHAWDLIRWIEEWRAQAEALRQPEVVEEDDIYAKMRAMDLEATR